MGHRKHISGAERNRKRKTNRMSDEEIIRHCLQGEKIAFERIVEKYKGKAMALALNILGNWEDAEDICQETFAKAFLSLKSFDPQRDFQNWIYSILYNSSIDRIRKNQRFFSFLSARKKEFCFADDTGGKGYRPEIPLPETYLQILEPKERTALILWATESYTSSEISSVLGCSASTVRVHLYKARKKVKSYIMEKKHDHV
jgi:RNA polymerase sigma-70 factor (ECF subfamily)